MTDQQLAERIVAAVRAVAKMPTIDGKNMRLTRQLWGVFFYNGKWRNDRNECACPLGAVLLIEQPTNVDGQTNTIAGLFKRDRVWVDGFIRAVDLPTAGAAHRHGDNGTFGYACGELVMSILAGEWKDIAI